MQQHTDPLREERARAIDEVVARVRAVEREHGVTRESLERICALLTELAGRTDLFSQTRYPAPADKPNLNYLLSEDPDRRFALYLSTGRPGRATPPHDHTTWAVIVGLDGVEENRLYERLDDGATPGHAEVVQRGSRTVGPGDGITFLPEDIHSVHVVSDVPTRHFHMYGRSLEDLPGRLQFDLTGGTCKVFPASPGIVRC